ncbi:MAG: hypothetical protein NVSMB32_18240 [Actinomycetota bacterium]
MPHQVEQIDLRATQECDVGLLRDLYSATRAAEFAGLGWTPDQLSAFLAMQYEARAAHYARHYPNAQDSVVMAGGVPVGRLMVQRSPEVLHLLDIALAPGVRDQGLGTRLLAGLIQEAGLGNKTLRLCVEANNPAQRLYRRLGFVEVAHSPPYLWMEWTAAQAETRVAS